MSDDQSPMGVHISAREIYDEIVGMRGDVRSLVETRETVDEKLGDHESRLRGLERWRYGLPVAGISAVVAGIASVYQSMHSK